MRPVTPFRFKQFSISHDKCAHKVGTDGVLLGAWAQANKPQSILDIGTGSGLIAIMLAQKFSQSKVVGIELDEPSFLQAEANAANSPFSERVQIINDDFLKHTFEHKFDLIVSNPPFYRGNTSTGKKERDRARHEEHLPQKDFIQKVTSVLSPEGKLIVILPDEEGEQFEKESNKQGLFLNRLAKVSGSPSAPIKRWLMELSCLPMAKIEESLTVRDNEGQRSEAYKEITKDFYL